MIPRGIKSWISYPESPIKLSLVLSLPLILVLLILFYSVIHWNKKSIEEIQKKNILLYAKALYQHIITSPLWRGPHYGYYMEVTQHLGVNPGRRLNIMGKEFVRVDPGIFTSKIRSIITKRAAYSFHITSLEAMGSPNKPDQWEMEVLEDFKFDLKKEAITSTVYNNITYYRYMAPIKLEGACLNCHSNLTAGLSIDIPVDYSDRLYAAQLKRSAITFTTFGVFILLFVMAITAFFSKRISDGFRAVRRLNSQLEELSAKNRRMLESIVDGIVVIGTNRTIEMVNPAFEGLFGIRAENLVGIKTDEIEIEGLKKVFNCASGEEIEIGDRILKVTDVDVFDEANSKKYGKIRIVHDATEEKLAAAMELAGAAAHEVRQPLAIIMNIIPLLKDRIDRGEVPDEELEILNQQCSRINEIIKRMLNITQYRRKTYIKDIKIFDLSDE
ncbi:MAG: DUF3365 domain-containing protein [Nitrospirae bacterium]|nr:DUF3365 domain-containing protein [Nitrospirota bacterium]